MLIMINFFILAIQLCALPLAMLLVEVVLFLVDASKLILSNSVLIILYMPSV